MNEPPRTMLHRLNRNADESFSEQCTQRRLGFARSHCAFLLADSSRLRCLEGTLAGQAPLGCTLPIQRDPKIETGKAMRLLAED
jgi:hypothetical protein